MFAILSLLVLAGQALAVFNITLGAQTLTGGDLINFTPSGPIASCANNCSMAQNVLSGCADVDSCLCSNNTATWLLNCQQCMYTQLIAANKPMPDPRAGSQPLLTAYSASCAASTSHINLTLAQTALTLPASWDGLVGIGLNTGETVVALIIGITLSVGSIIMLSNLD